MIDRCPLTNCKLKESDFQPTNGAFLEYKLPNFGIIKLSLDVALTKPNIDKLRYVFLGICKHRSLKNQPPILISSEFISKGYLEFDPPIEYKQKKYHLLRYLYENGGSENKSFDFNSIYDSVLFYCSPEEFNRIVDSLIGDGLLKFESRFPTDATEENLLFCGLKLSSDGLNEIEKSLPNVPIFGLISQEIITGDSKNDIKINHARELFFREPKSMENMRSACENLSYVLEPLRLSLNEAIWSSDVNDLFQIINKFDIRHNKIKTSKIEHEEQLEWIFYSLLNTINTYSKMINKKK